MDLSATWVPSPGGKPLEPLEEFRRLFDEARKPESASGSGWSRSEVKEALGGRSDCLELIWISVLSVWRLHQLEGNLEDATAEFTARWQDHLAAWLVRVSSVLGCDGGRD
jgi:hypothetical protein